MARRSVHGTHAPALRRSGPRRHAAVRALSADGCGERRINRSAGSAFARAAPAYDAGRHRHRSRRAVAAVRSASAADRLASGVRDNTRHHPCSHPLSASAVREDVVMASCPGQRDIAEGRCCLGRQSQAQGRPPAFAGGENAAAAIGDAGGQAPLPSEGRSRGRCAGGRGDQPGHRRSGAGARRLFRYRGRHHSPRPGHHGGYVGRASGGRARPSGLAAAALCIGLALAARPRRYTLVSGHASVPSAQAADLGRRHRAGVRGTRPPRRRRTRPALAPGLRFRNRWAARRGRGDRSPSRRFRSGRCKAAWHPWRSAPSARQVERGARSLRASEGTGPA